MAKLPSFQVGLARSSRVTCTRACAAISKVTLQVNSEGLTPYRSTIAAVHLVARIGVFQAPKEGSEPSRLTSAVRLIAGLLFLRQQTPERNRYSVPMACLLK